MRHLDDVDDLRTPGRDNSVLAVELIYVPKMAAAILESLKTNNRKRVHFLVSPKLSATTTMDAIISLLKELDNSISISFEIDQRIRELDHGEYRLGEDYEAGNHLVPKDLAWTAYTRETLDELV